MELVSGIIGHNNIGGINDMKILLIAPPWKRFFGSDNPVPPLSLNSIASYMESAAPEHKIDVFNCDYGLGKSQNIYNIDYMIGYDKYIRCLKNQDDPIWLEIHNKIKGYSPDVVGITAMTASYVSALNVARIVKKIDPSILVVMGGRHVSSLPENTLQQDCVDAVVIGDGELVFYNYIQAGAHPCDIKGMGYRDVNGNIIINDPQEPIQNLSTLPIPVFESTITKYENLHQENWMIVGARGCPFSCIYCADSNSKVRLRSVSHILDEIVFIEKRYGVKNFNFADDTFSLNKEHVTEFCHRLRELNLDISWSCNNRIDRINEGMLQVMRDANCYSMFLGIETGSNQTMERIKKKVDLSQCIERIRLAKKFDFIVSGYFIIGFPWEDEVSMRQTVDFMSSIGLDDFQLNIATPLPGTELFKQLEDQGKINIEDIEWERIYQGSPHMNYSDLYSDDEWCALLLKYTKIADRRSMVKNYSLILKKLIRNPRLILKIVSINSLKRYLFPILRRSAEGMMVEIFKNMKFVAATLHKGLF